VDSYASQASTALFTERLAGPAPTQSDMAPARLDGSTRNGRTISAGITGRLQPEHVDGLAGMRTRTGRTWPGPRPACPDRPSPGAPAGLRSRFIRRQPQRGQDSGIAAAVAVALVAPDAPYPGRLEMPGTLLSSAPLSIALVPSGERYEARLAARPQGRPNLPRNYFASPTLHRP